jgi:putative two-component system response regulator
VADGGKRMKHVLVVDDNKTNLISAKNVLAEQYKVTAVTMGAQALKFLEANTCDIILLDVDMPQMDGFEVIRKIKEMKLVQEPPVLFLTGNTDPETISRCIDEGGMDVVDKPFVKAILLNRIQFILELVEYRRTLADKCAVK